ncbi:hypothetical protein Tco_0912257 [Tanacetum coccineum]
MGEALMINRSQDLSFEDFIELNDLNTPIELRRNQVEDLGPIIGDGEVIDKPMIDIIKTKNNESFEEYPSYCDFDWKIHIDCAYNLNFSCMIVVDNMDGYRDQDMGDVIFREPFCKASCVKARRPLLKELAERCNVISALRVMRSVVDRLLSDLVVHRVLIVSFNESVFVYIEDSVARFEIYHHANFDKEDLDM